MVHPSSLQTKPTRWSGAPPRGNGPSCPSSPTEPPLMTRQMARTHLVPANSDERLASGRVCARLPIISCPNRDPLIRLSQGKFDEISGLVLPATIIQGGSFRHQLGENLHSGTITHLKANKKSLEIMREDTLVEGSAPGVNLSQVARIVSSYLRHHQLGPDQLIGLIVAVPSRARRPRAWPATSGEAA